MRIYIASSWKNKFLSEVIEALRTVGHEVYDFRNLPSGDPGFHWTDVDKDCYAWTPEQYQSNLMHPLAERQFHNDKEAMEHCDACVLVLPSGRSVTEEIINLILDVYEQNINQGGLTPNQITSIGDRLSDVEVTGEGVVSASTRSRIERLNNSISRQVGVGETQRPEVAKLRGVRRPLVEKSFMVRH